jgi:hypothetical protein
VVVDKAGTGLAVKVFLTLLLEQQTLVAVVAVTQHTTVAVAEPLVVLV